MKIFNYEFNILAFTKKHIGQPFTNMYTTIKTKVGGYFIKPTMTMATQTISTPEMNDPQIRDYYYYVQGRIDSCKIRVDVSEELKEHFTYTLGILLEQVTETEKLNENHKITLQNRIEKILKDNDAWDCIPSDIENEVA